MSLLDSLDPCKATLWLPLRDSFVSGGGLMSTRNLATGPNAPELVTLGNGVTAAGFPTTLSGKRGMAFNGSQFLDAGQAGATLTDNFTMYVCHNQISYTAVRALLSRHTGAVPQWQLYSPTAGLIAMAGVGSYTGATDNRTMKSPRVTAFVISSGVGAFYLNGNPDGASFAAAFTQQACNTIIGARSSAMALPFIGEMYCVAIFPAPHSPLQIAELSRRMKMYARLP